MARNWEYNNKEYYARLNVFYYICNNWYRFLQDKDGEFEPEPVLKFCQPYYTAIPSDVLEGLSPLQYKQISNTLDTFWKVRDHKHCYTVEDVLQELQWCFAPEHIDNFKLIYNAPKNPKKR